MCAVVALLDAAASQAVAAQRHLAGGGALARIAVAGPLIAGLTDATVDDAVAAGGHSSAAIAQREVTPVLADRLLRGEGATTFTRAHRDPGDDRDI